MKRSFCAASLFVCAIAVSVSAQTPARPTPTPARPTPTPARPPAAATPATTQPLAVPAAKIGLIDTTAFSSEPGGIKRYINAIKSVGREFDVRAKELTTIQNRLQVLSDEISRLRGAPVVDPKSIQAKVDEGERLQREAKFKKEQADADFKKRYEEVVGPITTDIGKSLDSFATQRGITLVLDAAKMLPAILTANPATDITQAFITEYNGRNP